MSELLGYMAGANLGHWISQYGSQGESHWDSYIQASDISRMKSWGLDHVRVPVDYLLFESDDCPGVYCEERVAYIDRVLSWCKINRMNMVLDLHHAPGFFFGDPDKNDLFTNPESQKRFVDIWRFFAERYRSEGDNLVFELLNEIHNNPTVPPELKWIRIAEGASEPWNILWQKTADEIFSISPHRRIVIGSNMGNSVNELKNLHISSRENIIYSFHFYEPSPFTHQRAGWWDEMKRYTKPISFPFKVSDHIGFWQGEIPSIYASRQEIGKDFIEEFMSPAFDFIEKTGKPVYCGEYGVIYNADDTSAVRWLNDVADLTLAHGIGRAVWSYRGFSTITSPDNQSWNHDMVKAISRKN